MLIQFLVMAAAVCVGAQASTWVVVGVNALFAARRERKARAQIAEMFGGPMPSRDNCPCPNCVARRAASAPN